MALALIINGTTFSFPEPEDRNWGANVTAWASAVTGGMFQKAGGSFTLTAEADFGATFGLKSAYFKSRGASPAATGVLRLANGESLSWRNSVDSADLALSVNGSDQLLFGGTALQSFLSVSDTATVDLTLASNVLSAAVQAASLSNSHVAVDAAIAYSKLAALSVSRAAQTSAAGVLEASAVTSVELGYVAGATSSIQTQLNARLQLSGGTMTGDLVLAAAPTSALHAATKQYVDDAIMGLSVRDSVRVATTVAGTLATSFENGDTVDGVVLATGNRILIKNQGASSENGIYVVAASGAPARATDADTWAELVQAFVFVTAGTANSGTSWVSQTQSGGTLGVNTVNFGQFGGGASFSADGQGIELSGTTFSLELADASLSKDGDGLKLATSGVSNAHIAAGAAIARSKTAAGTANRLVYNADTTGAMSDLAAITGDRAIISNVAGLPAHSAVTAVELGYVAGVTSAIQTQLNTKLSLTGGTLSGGLSGTTLALSGDLTCDDIDSDVIECNSLFVNGEEISTDANVYDDTITAEVVGSAAATIDLDSIPAFDYYEVYMDVVINNASGTESVQVRFNNDSGSNYAYSSLSSQSAIALMSLAILGTARIFSRFVIANPETEYKTLCVYNTMMFRSNSSSDVYTSTSTYSPSVAGFVGGAWRNNSSRVSRVTFFNGNGALFQVGSRVKIVGMNF